MDRHGSTSACSRYGTMRGRDDVGPDASTTGPSRVTWFRRRPSGTRRERTPLPNTTDVTGRWRITSMELWDTDAIDLVEPGFIEPLSSRLCGVRVTAQAAVAAFGRCSVVWVFVAEKGVPFLGRWFRSRGFGGASQYSGGAEYGKRTEGTGGSKGVDQAADPKPTHGHGGIARTSSKCSSGIGSGSPLEPSKGCSPTPEPPLRRSRPGVPRPIPHQPPNLFQMLQKDLG